MALVAASTHPTASWTEQQNTDQERYQTLTEDFQALARRQVISGMHIHCRDRGRGPAHRPDEPGRLLPAPSPGAVDQLALLGRPGHRPQGLPPRGRRGPATLRLARARSPAGASGSDLVETLTEVGLIEDATHIWWDIRPSAKHPTLELRITDICTSVEDALTIAALFQSLLHHLWRLRTRNQSWRHYRRILIEENKWRAQRWGVEAELADFAAGRLKPMRELVEELIELLREDAAELGCLAELERARAIVADGTSADRQLAVYRAALERGAEPPEALRAVVQLADRRDARGRSGLSP